MADKTYTDAMGVRIPTTPTSGFVSNGNIEYKVRNKRYGLDANTVLYLPCDDTNFTDGSASAHGNATKGGHAQCVTSGMKFGAGCYQGDGTTDYLAFADSDDWDLGLTFILDAWVNWAGNPATGSGRIMSHGRGRDNVDEAGWYLAVTTAGRLNLATLTAEMYADLQCPVGEWVHILASCDGTTLRMFKNGVLIRGQAWSSSLTTASDATLVVGASCPNDSYSGSWNGKLDEVRIVKGAYVDTEFDPMSIAYSTAP
jgi:hypothetical protein